MQEDNRNDLDSIIKAMFAVSVVIVGLSVIMAFGIVTDNPKETHFGCYGGQDNPSFMLVDGHISEDKIQDTCDSNGYDSAAETYMYITDKGLFQKPDIEEHTIGDGQ